MGVSLVVAVLLFSLLFCKPCGAAPAPHLEAFTGAANQAFYYLAAGYCLLTLGLLAAIASPAIPWWYGNGQSMTGLEYKVNIFGRTNSFVNPYLIGGSIAIYFGLVFVLSAWVMGLQMAVRVRTFLLSKTFPATGCCSPSMPAVVGCLWTGVLIVLGGASANWALLDLVYYFDAASASATPGFFFLIFAVLCLVAAAILFSYAGCLLRGMPGVGTSLSNCCRVERGTPAAALFQQPVATHPGKRHRRTQARFGVRRDRGPRVRSTQQQQQQHPIAGYPQVAPGFPAASLYQQPVAAYPISGYPQVDPSESMAAYPTPQGPPGMVVRSKDDPSTVAVMG